MWLIVGDGFVGLRVFIPQLGSCLLDLFLLLLVQAHILLLLLLLCLSCYDDNFKLLFLMPRVTIFLVSQLKTSKSSNGHTQSLNKTEMSVVY